MNQIYRLIIKGHPTIFYITGIILLFSALRSMGWINDATAVCFAKAASSIKFAKATRK